MRTLVMFVNEKSHEFWELHVEGSVFKEISGLLGELGSSTISNFDNETIALLAAKKRIRVKVSEGFRQQVMDPFVFMSQVN